MVIYKLVPLTKNYSIKYFEIYEDAKSYREKWENRDKNYKAKIIKTGKEEN